MIRNRSAALVAIVLTVAIVTAARTDEANDTAAITQRLQRWTADFNAKDPVGVCDLFAPDLMSRDDAGHKTNNVRQSCQATGKDRPPS
jgi:hypothetical protein